jgi:hypothetical protein
VVQTTKQGESTPARFAGDTGWLARVNDLDEHALAKHANESAVKAEGTFAYHAACAGVALLAAKAKVKHGDWGRWLEANWDRSERLARRYMELADECKRDPHKAAALGGGTIRGALSAVGRDQEGHGASQKPSGRTGSNRHRGADLPDGGGDVIDGEFVVRDDPKPDPPNRIKIQSLDDSPTEKVKEAEDSKPITAAGPMATRLAQASATAASAPAPTTPRQPVYQPPKAPTPMVVAVCGNWSEVSVGLQQLVEKFGEQRMRPARLSPIGEDDLRLDMYESQRKALADFARTWSKAAKDCAEDEPTWITDAATRRAEGAA